MTQLTPRELEIFEATKKMAVDAAKVLVSDLVNDRNPVKNPGPYWDGVRAGMMRAASSFEADLRALTPPDPATLPPHVMSAEQEGSDGE